MNTEEKNEEYNREAVMFSVNIVPARTYIRIYNDPPPKTKAEKVKELSKFFGACGVVVMIFVFLGLVGGWIPCLKNICCVISFIIGFLVTALFLSQILK